MMFVRLFFSLRLYGRTHETPICDGLNFDQE
jgi:hypothetical protein